MKIALSLLLSSLLLLDCEREASPGSIPGTWIVVSYMDNLNRTNTVKQDVESWNGMDVILNFMIDSICGINTTNSVFGKYAIKNDSIRVISFGGTKVGQPEWGNMFSDIVLDLETYRVEDNKLIFNYNNKRNSVILAPLRNIDPCRMSR